MSESIAISRQSSLVSDLRTVVRDIWGARDLLIQLTRRDITIRYKQAVMGMAWAVLMPMLIVISGLLIRLAMSRYAGRTLAPDTMAGIAVKSVPWAFFVGAIGFATPSLTGNINLVTKIYFPREVLTLSTVLAQTKDMAIGLVVMGLALPLFFGVSYHWTVLWVPLLLLLLLLITAAAGLFLACANLFFRDVKYLVQVFLTFGIFFTPIFFNASLLGGTAGTLVMLNPVAPILEGMYFAVVAGHNLAVPFVGPASAGGTSLLIWSPWSLVYSLMWGTVGLLASLLFFRRLSYLFAEYI